MTELEARIADLVTRIAPMDGDAAARAQALLDRKTKPRRSLGRLEDLACQLAAIFGRTEIARLDKTIVVMGADHGVAAEGVSAYPQDVTAQMMLNFANGGAAINVLGRLAGARVLVVDLGVKTAPRAGQILDRRIAAGTASFARGPAMSRVEATAAIQVGVDLAGELATAGTGLFGIGEMGIGNTTAASALTAVFTGAPPEEVTSRGTGIDDATLARKIDVIRRALAVNRPDPKDPLGALAKVGGLEIAGLCGVILGAAVARRPVIVDGFIAGVAALVAVRLAPAAAGYLIAAHRSVEVGHRLVLQSLGHRPLFDLELRLGEGTGAALAMPFVDAALAILAEMATFAEAGVSDSGR